MGSVITAASVSQTDVLAALATAVSGDTVVVPEGIASWFGVPVNAGITVDGQGAATQITLNSTGSTTTGVIRPAAGAVVKNLTLQNDSSSPPFSVASSQTGWRISGIDYTGKASTAAHFLFASTGAYGLVDQCVVRGTHGNSELIFCRGQTDAWDVDHAMGTANVVCVEDCTFSGLGYISDANSNARLVVRRCTSPSGMKVDGHGLASNTPDRGVRHVEAYDNTWTAGPGTWKAFELRGGGGRIVRNTTTLTDVQTGATMTLNDYIYSGSKTWSNNGNIWGTPANYPIRDQIGRGKYATPGVPTSATSEPMYIVANRRASDALWSPSIDDPNPEAIAAYGSTFTGADMIQQDRDYYAEVEDFDGTTGCGTGTKASMLAITATRNGVGYWVTDEGDWDATAEAGESGVLYRWQDGAWELFWVPLAYPHPLRSLPAVPSITASPASATRIIGQSITFTAAASGNPSPTFQWRKNGVAIVDATSAALTLSAVDADDAGSYDCLVTNSEGSVATGAATLTVNNVALGSGRATPIISRGRAVAVL